MKLRQLLNEIPGCVIKGFDDILITGVSSNSKTIVPGNLFIAKKGGAFDGNQFIFDAIQKGAVAVISDTYDSSLSDIVQVIYPNVSSAESQLADRFYCHPSRELFVVGLTGTNGKTTTSFIMKNLLDCLYGPCGLIGTIEYIIGKDRYKADRTTPDVSKNHQLLRDMILRECRSAVMEVTSHALEQGRVDKIEFDVAVFSNLTWDHLDYHGTMENYANAKKKLFDRLGKTKKKTSWAIVNQDTPWSGHMLSECSANKITYGIDQSADLQASHIRFEKGGTRALVTYQRESVECFWPLVGRFNVYNCLAAIGVALSQQFSLQLICSHLPSIPFIRGRLEPVKNDLGLQIYVDFAHSDDALLNILTTLKELQNFGRIIVVFGCGGDRDKAKRPKMGEVCELFANYSIITSDNPRSEDPQIICEEISKGFKRSDNYCIELDRKKAIEKAIDLAYPEDIILIAGKGHETQQIFAHQTCEFDDSRVAGDICKEKFKF